MARLLLEHIDVERARTFRTRSQILLDQDLRPVRNLFCHQPIGNPRSRDQTGGECVAASLQFEDICKRFVTAGISLCCLKFFPVAGTNLIRELEYKA
jgi:hypothetical protein